MENQLHNHHTRPITQKTIQHVLTQCAVVVQNDKYTGTIKSHSQYTVTVRVTQSQNATHSHPTQLPYTVHTYDAHFTVAIRYTQSQNTTNSQHTLCSVTVQHVLSHYTVTIHSTLSDRTQQNTQSPHSAG